MPSPSHPRLRRLAGCVAAAMIAAASLGSAATAATAQSTGTTAQGTGTVLGWTMASPASSPPKLVGAAAAYDPDDPQGVVLFGGIEEPSGTYSDETWVWNGNTWSQSQSPGGPPALAYASMAYDPALHQLILFGGEDSSGALYSGTWAWNGRAWTEQALSSCPPAREGAAFAYAGNGDLVLFGGTGPAPLTGGPTATSSTTATPTAASQSSCNSGGQTAAGTQPLGDTWSWNGTTWSQVSATGPPALSGASMAYDSSAATTVLFGGTTAAGGLSDQTWTWDGSAWKQQSPKIAPPPRSSALLADDPALSGELLVDGAAAGGTALGDVWLWTGSAWVQLAATGTHVASASPAGAYDSAESRLVVFEGPAGAGSSSQTDLAGPPAPRSTAGSPSSTTTVAPTPSTVAPKPRTTTKARPGPTTTTPVRPVARANPTAAAGSLSLTTSEHTVKRGTAVRLAGGGFEPGSTVTITFHSKPYRVGQVEADASGAFAAYVEVPASASPGLHHFEASGMAPGGKPAMLLASVFVVAPPGGHGTSDLTKAVLFLLAVLIPVGAWLGMSGMGRRRRRRTTRVAAAGEG